MPDVVINPAAHTKKYYPANERTRGSMLSANEIPREDRAALHAYQVLHVGFAVLPIIAGIDKFFNILTDWSHYVAPVALQVTGLSSQVFMGIAGVIEIIAGIGIFMKPKVFGYVVSAWLVLIVLNLIVLGNYYDVALRDLALAVGAFALAQISRTYELRKKTTGGLYA